MNVHKLILCSNLVVLLISFVVFGYKIIDGQGKYAIVLILITLGLLVNSIFHYKQLKNE